MNLVSQSYIYPVVVRTIEMKDAGMTLPERLKVFPWILSDLMFPFMTEYMLVSYRLSKRYLFHLPHPDIDKIILLDLVRYLGADSERPRRSYVLCGPWILRGLVEQHFLGSICPRLEQTSESKPIPSNQNNC